MTSASSPPRVSLLYRPALSLRWYSRAGAENLRLELSHFLAELDRLREREGDVTAAGGRIEAEVRGEAACLARSKLREVAQAHVGGGVVSGMLITPFQARSAR